MNENETIIPEPRERQDNILYEDIAFEEYLALDAINSSGLKKILRSPAHYKTPDTRETEALEFGRLLHIALFEPSRFTEEVVVRPKFDMRLKVDKQAAREFDEANEGKIFCSDPWYETLSGMASAVFAHPLAAKLLSAGTPETTVLWKDAQFGVRCKARFDWLSEPFGNVILDLKSTLDASPEAFGRDAWKYGYHLQAAHYTSGARATGHARHDSYVWLAVEKNPPYGVAVYVSGNPLDPSVGQPNYHMLGLGMQYRQKAMESYVSCKELDEWPCYSTEEMVLLPPPWAKAVDEELE